MEFTDGKFKGRKVGIEGELSLAPKFYATIDSIKNWEIPYDNTQISSDDIGHIMEEILSNNKKTKIEIVFD